MGGSVVMEQEQSEILVEEVEVHDELEEEVVVEDEDDDDDDDNNDDDKDLSLASGDGSKQSRSEKKCRKAMLKLGMKPLTGVTRVTIKRPKNMLLFISKPDVFKSPHSEAYVIEDLSSQLHAQAAQQFTMPDMSSMITKPQASGPTLAAQEEEAEEEVDDTGVEPRDIELVMTQAGVTKSKAVKAIKTLDGDIVSAIMELTT